MSIIVSESKKEYTPAPPGVHQGVCCDVVDLGEVEVTYQNKTRKQHKIRIVWELDEVNEKNGKAFQASRRYTASLDQKASLRKDLESWRGRPFTSEELAGFDLEKLLGANAMLNIVHTQRDGETYANVQAVMPLHKGMQKIGISKDYVRVKDRTDDGQQSNEPPDWVSEEAPAF